MTCDITALISLVNPQESAQSSMYNSSAVASLTFLMNVNLLLVASPRFSREVGGSYVY